MPADSSSSPEAFAFMVDVMFTTAALLPSTMVVKSGSVCTAAGPATCGAACACATCAAGVAAPACEEGKFAAPAQYPPAMSAAAPRPAKANFAFMGNSLIVRAPCTGTDRIEGARVPVGLRRHAAAL